MAKALKVVGKVASVAAVVLAFIPGGQPFAAAASAISGIANAGAALLEQPKPQGGAVSKVMIDTSAPSPYVIGRTMTGGVLVHDAGYGADYKKIKNPNRSMAFVYSEVGPVQQIEGLYTDGAYAVSIGAVSGYYSGSMHFDRRLGSRPDTALAGNQGSIPRWGSSYKLSGKACGMVTMRWDKNMKKFSGGVPELSVVMKGVKVYSARLDSTYPGGSGTCRPYDETTYVYSENPADHALTYCLGRYEGSRRIFGVGKRFEAMDVAAFVEWANVCDANGWKVGGVIYEPADKWNNLKLIMQAGSARPVHNAGILSVAFDSPKVALETFTEDDLANGEPVIPATQTFRNRINGIVPRYRSSAHNWEYVPGTTVSIASYVTEDGEDKKKEIQYTLCQAANQAAQLAAYEIVNARELRGITLPMKPKILPYSSGEAIELDMPNLGLIGIYTIISRRFDPLTGIVEVSLVSETPTKHAFALGATTTPPEIPSLLLGEDMDATRFAASGSEDTLQTMISTSWTKNLVLTSTVDSAAGKIVLSNHSRVYPDETVSLIGDEIPTLALDTRYSVYYDDDDRDGGAVTYVATTTHDDAQTSETNPSRHFIGYVTTPATTGSGDVTGVTSTPPTVVPETVPNADNLGGRSSQDILSDITQVQADLDAAEASIISGDAVVQASVNSAINILEAADSNIQVNIDNAVDALEDADEALDLAKAEQSDLDVEAARIDVVNSQVSAVEADITSLETTKADATDLTAEAARITQITSQIGREDNLYINPLNLVWNDAAPRPVGWGEYYTNGTSSKETGITFNGAYSHRMNITQAQSDAGDFGVTGYSYSNQNGGAGTDWDKAFEPNNNYKRHVVYSQWLYLESGSWDGAGYFFYVYDGSLTALNAVSAAFGDLGSIGKWVLFEKVIDLGADTDTNGAADIALYRMGNYFGPRSPKNILWGPSSLRPANSAEITNLTVIPTIQSDITSLENTKADGTDLTTEANRITALSSRVGTTEGDIAQAESDIVNIENTKADASDLTTESNRITALTSRVNTAEGDIGTIESDVTSLENTKADASDLTTEAARIDALSSRVTTTEGDITQAESDITNLETTKADGTALTTEANRITALSSRVTTAEGEIDTAQSDITSLETTKADASDLTTEAARIDALSSRVTTTEGDITQVESDITNLETTKADASALTTEAARIDTLRSDIDTPATGISAQIFTLSTTKADLSALTAEAARIDQVRSNAARTNNRYQNPLNLRWDDAAPRPVGWGEYYTNGTSSKETSIVHEGGYSHRMNISQAQSDAGVFGAIGYSYSAQNGGAGTDWDELFTPSTNWKRYNVYQQWLYLESGSWDGAGYFFYVYDGSTTYLNAVSGAFGDLGSSGKWVLFETIIDFGYDTDTGGLEKVALFRMGNYFSPRSPKNILWGPSVLRSATDAEVAEQIIRPAMQADITTLQSATSSLEGRTNVRFQIAGQAGDGRFIILADAEDDGNGNSTSNILIGAQQSISFVILDVNGDVDEVVDALTIVGGEARFSGLVNAAGFTIGDLRLPVAVSPVIDSGVDGDIITFGGSVIEQPEITFDLSNLPALAVGERYEVTAINRTLSQFELSAKKISTGGTTTTITDTADAGGTGGDPDRVMNKTNTNDASSYIFTIKGTIEVQSNYEPEGGGVWFHIGSVSVKTQFNDGTGWVDGPVVQIYPSDAGVTGTGSNQTGTHNFTKTVTVNWGNTIGQHASEEFGITKSGGLGTVTDLFSVKYNVTTGATASTATPNGELIGISIQHIAPSA